MSFIKLSNFISIVLIVSSKALNEQGEPTQKNGAAAYCL